MSHLDNARLLVPPLEPVLDDSNPWPGLATFSEDDKNFFFGRDHERDQLAQMIESEPLTVLFGKSGLGKSSLLRAGVGPLLRSREFVPFHIRLNHNKEAPLLDQVKGAINKVLQDEDIAAPDPKPADTLWEYFHRRDCTWWDRENHSVKPILFFDQFEDLLILRRERVARQGEVSTLLDELADLIENRPPRAVQDRLAGERSLAANYNFDRVAYRIVVSLREDYLADLEDLSVKLRSVMRNRFHLRPMTRQQAMEVIRSPRSAHLVDPEVAEQIIQFVVSSDRESASLEEDLQMIVQHVDPALLSAILQQLNNDRKASGLMKITSDLLGNHRPEEILKNIYERGLEAIADTATRERVRSFIATELLTPSGKRNKMTEEEAIDRYSIPAAAIRTLVEQRILDLEQSRNLHWIELKHDRLADVIKPEREQLESANARARVARLRENAERDADDVVEHFRKMLTDITPGAAAGVFRDLEQVRADAREFASPRLDKFWASAEALGAEILDSQGYVSQSRDAAEYALKAIEQIERGDPSSPIQDVRVQAIYALGRARFHLGDLPGAEETLRAAVQLFGDADVPWPLHLRTMTHITLGQVLNEAGQRREAQEIYRAALEGLDRDASDDAAYLKVTALIALAATIDSYDSRQPVHLDARTLIDRGSLEHPHSLRWRLLNADLSVGEAFDMQSSGLSAAGVRLKAALRDARAVFEIDPKNLYARYVLSRVLRAVGMHHRTASEEPVAVQDFSQMKDHAEGIEREQPAWLGNLRVKALSLYYLAEDEMAERKRALLQEACGLMQKLAETSPTSVGAKRDLAVLFWTLGVATEDLHEALQIFRNAAAQIENLPLQIKETSDLQDILGSIHLKEAAALEKLDNPSSAIQDSYRSALRANKKGLTEDPTPSRYISLAWTHQTFGAFLHKLGAKDRAALEFQNVMEAYTEALTRHHNNLELLNTKCARGLEISRLWRKSEDLRAAVDYLTPAIQTIDEALSLEPVNFSLCELAKKVHQSGLDLAAELESKASQDEDFLALAARVKESLIRIAPERLLWPGEARTEGTLAHVQSWQIPPLLPGAWRALRPAEKALELKFLESQQRQETAARIGRMRVVSLSFYPGAILYEAEVARDGRPPAILGYVRSGSEALFLDGTSPPIHKFNRNEKVRLALENPSQVADYARFFTASIQASEGNFRLVDSLADVPMAPSVQPDGVAGKRDRIFPIQVREAANGNWDTKATVRYAGHLYYSFFQVPLNGIVEMKKVDEEIPVASIPFALSERFEDGLRVIVETPQVRRRRHAKAREWPETVAAQMEVVTSFRETKDLKPDDLASALQGLSWNQLHAKDFDSALVSSQEACKLNPADIALETNLAHALMLVGRVDEAAEIYGKHIGEKYGERNWEDVILEDFESLNKEGITHPEMDRFRERVRGR